MKIACVDEAAADRIRLEQHLEWAYEQCRDTVGHLPTAQVVLATKEEILMNSAPDAVIVGPALSIEAAYSACREFRDAHPNLTIIALVPPDRFSLRTLRRFQRVVDDIFSIEDQPIRLIHKLSSLQSHIRARKEGKIIAMQGVKGGVGTTSITAALAHAAEALGKSAVVVDLSRAGALLHYLSSQRWQSPDFAAALSDNLTLDRALVQRCLTTVPNGINILLPPAGGSDTRDLWLRNPEKFEISLTFLDSLCELYDVVLVDMAAAEGVLPFAIAVRACSLVLVSSNDPAAVHLLNSTLSELSEAPREGPIHVIVNLLLEHGLTQSDVCDFLAHNEHYQQSMTLTEAVPFDAGGRGWIGTGNSFYTESCSRTQRVFDDVLCTLLLDENGLQRELLEQSGLFAGLRKFARNKLAKRKRVHSEVKALPYQAECTFPESNLSQGDTSNNSEPTCAANSGAADDSLFYEAPKQVVNGGGAQ